MARYDLKQQTPGAVSHMATPAKPVGHTTPGHNLTMSQKKRVYRRHSLTPRSPAPSSYPASQTPHKLHHESRPTPHRGTPPDTPGHTTPGKPHQVDTPESLGMRRGHLRGLESVSVTIEPLPFYLSFFKSIYSSKQVLKGLVLYANNHSDPSECLYFCGWVEGRASLYSPE